jgi:transposase-like protein
MARLSEEFKYSIMMKMMPPENQSISSIAKETGLSEGTLYLWRKQARSKGLAVPSGEIETERWSTRDKFNIVLETATLSEVELAEYCRSKGLFAEQVKAWQEACMQANGGIVQQVTRLQKELRQKDQELKKTEKELKRKEAALAETAALLVLRKKADAIWGDGGDA